MNQVEYGQPEPPTFDFSSFSGIPIALFCGKTDKLAAPADYEWLRDKLAEKQNCIYYRELDFGHIAFLMPSERDRRYFIEMLELTKHFNQHYEGPQRSQIPKDFILS